MIQILKQIKKRFDSECNRNPFFKWLILIIVLLLIISLLSWARVMIILSTFLLIGVLVLWVDRETAKKPWFQALLTVLTSFLGIFLALSINSHHEHRQTISNLIRISSTAKNEAESSLAIIKNEKESLASDDNRRLVLESPTKALVVLLGMPTFIELGSTEIVTELLTLSTQLKWQRTYSAEFVMTGVSGPNLNFVTANTDTVISNVERVIYILEKQLSLFKDLR